MSNIKDVAKAAGVSVSTVSNILNGKVFVSEELHQKVIKAMQELDYHPNFLAMNLRKKKIGFIGVIVSSLAGHYNQIVDGIYRIAKENKCQPILKIANNASEEHLEIESLLQLSVSGIIVISSNFNKELVEHYKSAAVPVVFADLYPKNSEFNVVRFDNYKIVRKLTEKLVSQGKEVGLITGHRFLGSEEDCIQGYEDGLKSTNQKNYYLFETDLVKEHAFSELMEFMYNSEKIPNCLIVSASQLGNTVMEVLSLLGIENTSVVVLAGDSWHGHSEPNLSYQTRDAIYCGMQAATLLLENIERPAAFDTKYITIDDRTDMPEAVTQEPQATVPSNQKKTLKLLLLRSNISNAIEKLSRDFTANSGIDISVTAVSQLDLIQIILDNAKNKSSEYDIIMADMHWLEQLKQENIFCKLNGLLPLEEILPRYVHDVRNYILSEADGTDLYSLPILSGYQILAYRSDLFEDPLLQKKFYLHYGVPLAVPRSWNEFNLIARFFTKSINKESPIDYGTCITGRKPQGIMAEFLPRQWSYNGQFLGRSGLDLVSVANLKAVKNLCESYEYSYPDCIDFLEDEQVQEFLKGNIAMISTYNVHLQDKLRSSDQKIQFARIPGSTALIGGWLLGINANSKQIEESAQFLQWELSVRTSLHSSLLGQISPFKSVFYDDEISTIYPWMSIIKKGHTLLRGKELETMSSNNDDIGHSLEEALSTHLQRAFKKEIEPEDVLKLTQQEFQ